MSAWTYRDPSFGDLPLDDTTGMYVVSYDLGFPQAREVVEAVTNADGEADATAYHSGRVVSLDVRITGTPSERQAAAMTVRRFMHPARRVTLVWESEAFGALWFEAARGSGFAAPVGRAMSGFVTRHVWRVPSGVMVSATERVAEVIAGAALVTGRTYDLVYDRVYPAGAAPGSVNVETAGTTTAYPVLRLYGPITNPRAQLVTTGGNWDFTANGGLVVAAGDWVEIDTRAQTALLNGLAASSVLDKINFATLAWAGLAPGVNEARYNGSAGVASTTVMTVTYRDTYL